MSMDVSVWVCELMHACVCIQMYVCLREPEKVVGADVYIINVCSEYLQEEIHVYVCISVEWWQLWVVHREVKHTEEMCEDT